MSNITIEEKFLDSIINGTGGFKAWEDREFVAHADRDLAIAAWTLRCLGNVKNEQSKEVIDRLLAHRNTETDRPPQPADPKPFQGGQITPGRFVPEEEIQKLREWNGTGLIDDILDAVDDFLQAIEKTEEND